MMGFHHLYFMNSRETRTMDLIHPVKPLQPSWIKYQARVHGNPILMFPYMNLDWLING